MRPTALAIVKRQRVKKERKEAREGEKGDSKVSLFLFPFEKAVTGGDGKRD